MPFYLWKGINQLGNTIKGITQAASPEQLKELLLAQQIALLACNEQQSGRSWLTHSFQRRINNKQLCDFFERLSLLINNGVELVHALEVLVRLTPHQSFANIIQQMAQSIAQGQSFHAALQAHPLVFPSFISHMVKVGEKTGKLGLVLEDLKTSLTQERWLQQELRRAALAPGLTLMVAILLIGGILIFIVPHFQLLYQSLATPLPAATQWLLSLHNAIWSGWGLACFLALIASIGIFKILLKNIPIRRWVQTACLQLPIINRIIINSCLISFTQTLSLFLDSGLALTQALHYIQQTTHNLVFKSEVEKISSTILDGGSLYDAINTSNSVFFDEQFLALIQVGERSGKLAQVLKSACLQYQEIFASYLHTITTLFAPILMIFIGLLVGGIMVLIYLPIFSLGNLFV